MGQEEKIEFCKMSDQESSGRVRKEE